MLITRNKERVELHSPTALPKACSFLWNSQLMIQVNCRGYATAQFMQPEPAKYAHGPIMQATTFMLPEQSYYTHHPGRFFYIKDEETGEFFSAPYEPVRAELDQFIFSAGKSDIRWTLQKLDMEIRLSLSLPMDQPLELWSLEVINLSDRERHLSIYPYFPAGYMSWMYQGGKFSESLNAIVCSSITPYQKSADYYKIKHFKDKTFLLSDRKPESWEVRQEVFEGEGGLHAPDGIARTTLLNNEAHYEVPACIMQYRLSLQAKAESKPYRFVFGPAQSEEEILAIRQEYFIDKHYETRIKQQEEHIRDGEGCLEVKTPDADFDHFVNHWLARQLFYHGDVNRLCTDPQTRNYLQDNMGMSYIKPSHFRRAFLHALSQQSPDGAMPDGILLHEQAELKYINQVPHTDHCIWLPVCLQAYLDETNDYELLEQSVSYEGGNQEGSVFEHINKAMEWLVQNRDHRGLSYIAQGDWCDPMNMVGHKGKGVSGWLTVATAYACKVWSNICKAAGQEATYEKFFAFAQQFNEAANTHLWDGQWFARGITDDHISFGIAKDQEGRIYLNPQSWAILSGATDQGQQTSMIQAVESQLETPYGVTMLAPAYTAMREDVGRLTQKYPGAAENGSVYNHASAFYIYSLYTIGEADRAFRLLRQMIPGPDWEDYVQRGQLPVFIPNYYRGAYHQFPEAAGRSSQLFNTGTIAWLYRCLIEGLFGVRGDKGGLNINPQLPAAWREATIVRRFRGAKFNINIKRITGRQSKSISVNGEILNGTRMTAIETGQYYTVEVEIP